MRKLIVISILLISQTSMSQNGQIRSMAGFALSTLDDASLRFGAFSGLNYKMIYQKYVSFSFGLEYIGKGTNQDSYDYEYFENTYSDRKTIAHDFLSIPLTIGYHGDLSLYDDISDFYVSVESGLLWRFLLKAKEKRVWKNEFFEKVDYTEEDVTETEDRLFLSGLFQINVGYNITEQHSIAFQSRYSFGIIRNNTPSNLQSASQEKVIRYLDKSGVFSIGYTFSFN